MVKKRELKISVTKSGEIQIDVLNAEGSECLEWTREIETLLEGEIRRELKAGYYESSREEISQSN